MKNECKESVPNMDYSTISSSKLTNEPLYPLIIQLFSPPPLNPLKSSLFYFFSRIITALVQQPQNFFVTSRSRPFLFPAPNDFFPRRSLTIFYHKFSLLFHLYFYFFFRTFRASFVYCIIDLCRQVGVSSGLGVRNLKIVITFFFHFYILSRFLSFFFS